MLISYLKSAFITWQNARADTIKKAAYPKSIITAVRIPKTACFTPITILKNKIWDLLGEFLFKMQ